jgi:hypothetical protein
MFSVEVKFKVRDRETSWNQRSVSVWMYGFVSLLLLLCFVDLHPGANRGKIGF